jgi:hypothetical protein
MNERAGRNKRNERAEKKERAEREERNEAASLLIIRILNSPFFLASFFSSFLRRRFRN